MTITKPGRDTTTALNAAVASQVLQLPTSGVAENRVQWLVVHDDLEG